MPLFEFDAGRLIPAQVGRAVNDPVEPEVLDAVRVQVLELLQLQLFPVTWQDDDGAPRLTAMDAAGQVVSIEVVERLDAQTLVAALGRSGRSGGRGWVEVARTYPRGLAAFRRDWNAYREAQPAGAATSARAHVVAASIDEDVRPALDALSGAGVVIHELSARAMSNGRMFLDVAEVSAPITPLPWLLPGRPTMTLESAAQTLPVGSRRAARAAREAAEQAQLTGSDLPDGETPAAAQRAADPPTREERPSAQPSYPAEPAATRAERAREPATRVEEPAPVGLSSIGESLGGPTPLVWVADGAHRAEATLLPEGRILVGERSYTAPEAAASAVLGTRPRLDAWHGWRFGERGPSLREAQEELAAAHRRRRAAAGPGVRRRDRRRRAASE